CPDVSTPTNTGDVQLWIPAVASAHAKLTVASVLFQPAPLAAGDTDAVMVGDTSSDPRIVTDIPDPALPCAGAPSTVMLNVLALWPAGGRRLTARDTSRTFRLISDGPNT